jgi:dihydroorotate dehydrogenase
VAGLKLSNPIGLAAGFDKQAEAIDGLLNLGFGIVEVGSVTPEPQPGNEKPRYFRLTADRAAINRYGFNSEGHDVILGRLRQRVQQWILGSSNLARSRIAVPDSTSDTAQLLREADINTVLASDHVPKSLRPGQLLAVNLGKNKTSPEDSVQDYVKGVEKLGEYADIVVINVSSPNTPGLRGMQRKEILHGLMSKVVEARNHLPSKVPILVKISPDLSKNELNDIADAAISSGIEGLIVSNTTTTRPSSLLSDAELTDQKGGLSGAPLKPLALEAVQTVRRRVGKKMTIIGCGGIFSGEDALDFAKAGADAIELYTSFGYEGVGHPRRVKDELVAILKSQGKTWKASVGSGLEKGDYLSKLPSGEKETLTGGGLNERFGMAVADVKGQLEDLRRSVGLASNKITSSTPKEEETKNILQRSTSPTARPIFRPDPSDKEYTSLLDKIDAALGLDHADIKGEKMMETDMTQGEALRVKLGIALQDPVVPPSAAIEGLGEQATVAGGQPTSGRIAQPPSSLRLIDARGTSASVGQSSELQKRMRAEAAFKAADKARVV